MCPEVGISALQIYWPLCANILTMDNGTTVSRGSCAQMKVEKWHNFVADVYVACALASFFT